MGNRKATERGVRKLTRSGGSLNVSLPIELIKSLGWREKQNVVVKKIGGALVVRDAPTPQKLRGASKTKRK